MILIDANLLIYSHAVRFPQHAKAQAWLDEQLNGTSDVGLPWVSLLAFLRITTNPRIFTDVKTVEEAWAQVHAWLHCDRVWIPQPTENHAAILAGLLSGHSSAHANLVGDAHLAALALEHGLTLCSADGDFARFPGLRWENPLVNAGR